MVVREWYAGTACYLIWKIVECVQSLIIIVSIVRGSVIGGVIYAGFPFVIIMEERVASVALPPVVSMIFQLLLALIVTKAFVTDAIIMVMKCGLVSAA